MKFEYDIAKLKEIWDNNRPEMKDGSRLGNRIIGLDIFRTMHLIPLLNVGDCVEYSIGGITNLEHTTYFGKITEIKICQFKKEDGDYWQACSVCQGLCGINDKKPTCVINSPFTYIKMIYKDFIEGEEMIL